MKPSFNDFLSTCTPLVKISQLEQQYKERVQGIIDNLLDFQPSSDLVQNLKTFLRKDDEFFGVILALTNISQEKFLRIISARRFSSGDFSQEWNMKRIKKKFLEDDTFADEITKLFVEGSKNISLSQIVPDFYLDQLNLPTEWAELIKDEIFIGNIIRKKLHGEYQDAKGDYIEELMREKVKLIAQDYGFSYDKGQVKSMALDKEVDLVVPSLMDPHILIMCSYMETTSSGQTARANEQNEMYQKVISERVRYSSSRVFVNFVDGAGWLARRSDLRKLYNGCDYCLNIKSIEQIETIIFKHLPKKFFTAKQPPDPEGE